MSLFSNASLVTKTMLTLLLGLVIVAAGAGLSIVGQQQALRNYQSLMQQEVVHEQQLNVLNLQFKTQVQEWKNVLLRGVNEQDRSKYWDRFKRMQQQIQTEAQQLLKALRKADEPDQKLVQFIDEHQQLFTQYQHGFQRFQESGFDPHQGDSVVRGIDRHASQLLAELAQELIDTNNSRALAVQQHANEALWSGAIIMLLSGLLAFVLSRMLLMKQLVQPLQRVMAALDRMANGHFERPLTFESHDEIGRLADNVRYLQSNLVALLSEVADIAARLASSSAQLQGSARDTDVQIDGQSAQVQQIATAMTEMSASASDVAANVQHAHTSTNNTNTSVGQGQQQLQQSVQALGSLDTTMGQSSEVIAKLAEQSEHIGGILDVIGNIADQTNLLALNAAIEAARAGEQGRGFAVVADEVRSLASRTQQSTAQIHTMIGDLQHHSEQAVIAMDQGRKELSHSVTLADAAESELTRVVDDVAQLTQVSEEIATAAEQQGRVSAEVSDNLHRMVTMAQQLSVRSHETTAVATDLAVIAEQLQGRIAKYHIR
ncbi:methyl-accepting chemotaxis protein [uncultured Ferrimonas sp.]|uniref:methyl-accepting chemotaxis protein n=1 Tax=uncultured Ferrimonas sp. TaxID=432640 RepID=UPI00260ECEF8|nr:methyl-accepting chemotaxis protein [uncultured Ferrimonas sp.]